MVDSLVPSRENLCGMSATEPTKLPVEKFKNDAARNRPYTKNACGDARSKPVGFVVCQLRQRFRFGYFSPLVGNVLAQPRLPLAADEPTGKRNANIFQAADAIV